jgi:hypothetical protein
LRQTHFKHIQENFIIFILFLYQFLKLINFSFLKLIFKTDNIKKNRKRIKNRRMPVPEAILRFAKLSANATAPTKATPHAAGYDLYSAYEYTVPPRGKVLALTDIQIAVPENCYGRVAPRSGLAHKNFIDVGGKRLLFGFLVSFGFDF